jgi:ferredoxin
MPYVVTEQCINCKHTDCVSVCPVDCFYEGPNFLAINPDECIDCGLCEPECPVKAIKPHDALDSSERIFLDLNRDFAKAWPNLNQVKPPHAEAKRWAGVPDKLALLQRAAATEVEAETV